MKKHLRKTFLWGSALLIYGLLLAVVVSPLLKLDKASPVIASQIDASGGQESVQSLINRDGQDSGISGLLLPLGPRDGRLPGSPFIWNEFMAAERTDPDRLVANGFDGLQVVKNYADFSKGSVAELFLSGIPLKVFKRGNSLLVLTAGGRVQEIDCTNPREPKKASFLPYQHVNFMAMRGDTAYLLLSTQDSYRDKLVIVDLTNPREPRDLSRHSLPNGTVAFYLSERYLSVYTSANDKKVEGSVYLYELTDNSQLVAIGEAEASFLASHSLKYKNYLYVPGLRAGLQVYDVSDPLRPVFITSLSLSSRIKHLSQRGDKLFASSPSNRMYVINLQDPAYSVLSAVVEEANYYAYIFAYGAYSYYFTLNGYLRVFDLSFPDSMAISKSMPVGLDGELVALQAGDNFTLLGRTKGSLPAAVAGVLALPDQTKIVDTQPWQGLLAVLDENGRIQFFRQKQSSLQLLGSLTLPTAQRWLTATDERLYVGGETSVYIIAKSDEDNFSLSAQIELPVRKSWDGLVIEQTLCLAAGKDGLLCLALKTPDRPEISPGLLLPEHVESQFDIRQLATPGSRRVLAAAGPAGLLSGRINSASQFQLEGIFDLKTPARALAVVNGFCLVSTANEINVIDIRDGGSLQNLGEISFSGVARFAVADPGYWAGYVSGEGWYVLPVPRLMSPGDAGLLQPLNNSELSSSIVSRYRLNLFNDNEVITVPGVLSLAALIVSDKPTHDTH